jgi:branched-chain amino acid transport system permease protein
MKTPDLSRFSSARGPIAAGLISFVLLVLAAPTVLSAYWLSVLTTVVIYSIVTLSLVLLFGRVGMISLCQVAVLGLGGWIALRLGFGTSLPFFVLLLGTGVVTGLIGTLIGLPALRLRGLYLALITLMAAAAFSVALTSFNLPNGGGGFFGYDAFGGAVPQLRRPSIATDDTAFYRCIVVVTAVLFALVMIHLRTRPGRAWTAIRESEPGAIAAGVNITLYKLWAFALASFITGIAGCLLAASPGGITIGGFPTQDSVTIVAVVLLAGTYSVWGAVVAALFFKLLPALLGEWGLPADSLTVLFGVGVIIALVSAPRGLVEQVPADLKRLYGAIRGSGPRTPKEKAST